jgi:capsular polysaccharide biosynthesis protein
VSPGGETRAPGIPEAEREIDLSRYWWAIVARWWLVAGAVAAGIVIGYLVSLGGGTVFQSKATVYLGQPLTPTGAAQVQGLQTNPSTVGQIVRSRSVVAAVASAVDIPADALRNGISSRPVSGSVARLGQTPLVEITVRGPWRRQGAEAANLLADEVVERVSGYAATKIEQLRTLLASQDQGIAATDEAIGRYREALGSGTSLPATDQLVLVGLLDGAERDRGQLVEARTQTQLSLALAEEVEHGQVVTRASAVKVAARSRRSSLAVGAVVGLVAGLVLAVGWEAVARRRRERSED